MCTVSAVVDHRVAVFVLGVTKSTLYGLILLMLLPGGYVHVTCGFPLYTYMTL